MRPILFQIGEFSFPSYQFLIMVGVLVAVYLGVKVARRMGLPVIYVFDMAILGIIAAFIGARIAHLLVEGSPPEYPNYYWENWLRVFYFWQGGFVSWGGYLPVALTWYFYLKWRGQPVWAYFDMAGIVTPIALFFGRTGCLFNGCCFGKPTDFFLHLAFKYPASTAYYFYPNIPLHATQIYLMAKVLLIAAFLYFFSQRRWRFQGQLFSLAIGIYAVLRFLIEFLRGDVERGVYFNDTVSSGQIVMVIFLISALVMYFYFRRKGLPVPKKIS